MWDADGNRMLVFGGSGPSGSGLLNDLWSYQAASNSWTQLTPSGTPPPARFGHTAVWDAAGNRMLVFGGCCFFENEFDPGSYFNDLWSYDASSNSWVQLTQSGSPPPARYEHTAVWDTAGVACCSSVAPMSTTMS